MWGTCFVNNALNEQFIEWTIHWVNNSLSEQFIEWTIHWMNNSLNEQFIEWTRTACFQARNDDKKPIVFLAVLLLPAVIAVIAFSFSRSCYSIPQHRVLAYSGYLSNCFVKVWLQIVFPSPEVVVLMWETFQPILSSCGTNLPKSV